MIDWWFHIPIPTLTIEGKWPTLTKVWIDYATGTWSPNRYWTSIVYINEVYIFDGNEKLKGGVDKIKSSEGDAVWVGTETPRLQFLHQRWYGTPILKQRSKKV